RSSKESWLLGADSISSRVAAAMPGIRSASIFCRVSSISISILLVVVVAASDVFVVSERAKFFLTDGNSLEANAQKRLDVFAARGGRPADVQRACACGVEASGAVLLAGANEPEHDAVAHLRTRVLRERHRCDPLDVRTELPRPTDEPLR